jgi:hypothetical protein
MSLRKVTMTAEEWDSSSDFRAMTRALEDVRSTRKWHCFAVACVSLIWDRVPDHLREIIKVTERFIQRKASNGERSRARLQMGGPEAQVRNSVEWAVYWASAAPTDINSSARGSVPYSVRQVLLTPGNGQPPLHPEPDRLLCDLLREIFPNPARTPRIEPAWLRWSDGAVRRVAETTDEEGDLARLPVLADALEEAGCTDEHLLGHLRGPGNHWLGCWALDLCTARK